MALLDVVDESDKVVKVADFEEVHSNNLTHRVVHVLVFNNKDEMALQLRSRDLKQTPHHWAPAASGYVNSGESYEQAALREAEEEIGKRLDIAFQAKYLHNSPKGQKFLAVFVAKDSGPFVLNEEVERVEFFTLNEIVNMIPREKMHPELLFLLRELYNIDSNITNDS